MPIVFVPGIGVRPNPRGERRREQWLRRYLGGWVAPGGLARVETLRWAEPWEAAEVPASRWEALGPRVGPEPLGRLADRFGEGLRQGLGWPVGLVSRPLAALAIGCLRRPLTAAAGDLLIWLEQRRLGRAGAIRQRVAGAVAAAARGLTPADARLLLLGHSLGGVLLYEALAAGPVPAGTVLVTVGSPLALFATLGLLGPPPEGLARWLNVWDPADPIAGAAGAVWPGVEDWRWRTGALVWAHGGYLARPRFYRWLGRRLARPTRRGRWRWR